MKPSTLTRLKSLKLTRTAPTPAARLNLLHLLDQGLQVPAVRAILVNKDFNQDLVSTTTTTTIITTSVSVESVRSPRPVRQNHSEGMSRKYFCARNNFSLHPQVECGRLRPDVDQQLHHQPREEPGPGAEGRESQGVSSSLQLQGTSQTISVSLVLRPGSGPVNLH